MKLGRNDPCPCGSGKKYKRCCLNDVGKQHAQVFDDVEHMLSMNPNLSIDELNIAMQHKVQRRNDAGIADFCGLSPNQIANWLHEPIDKLTKVSIHTPNDLSLCPVMCCLTLILELAMENGGSFKATAKGNLPSKLVKQASDLSPEFNLSNMKRHISLSDFAGSNEDKFNALHYTRVLAEIAGIIYLRSGRYHVKKVAQTQYLKHGIHSFFQPLLEAACYQYNWGYLDAWEDQSDLRLFWLFMLWRIQTHGDTQKLNQEVVTAFPDLLRQMPDDPYVGPTQVLSYLIERRFIEVFLGFWGFATLHPKRLHNGQEVDAKVEVWPLLEQTFVFDV